jgi:hypothetical protein
MLGVGFEPKIPVFERSKTVGITDGQTYEVHRQNRLKMASYTYHVPWRSVQAFKLTLRLLPKQFRGCKVGITDSRDL